MGYYIRYQPEKNDKYPEEVHKRKDLVRIIASVVLLIALLSGVFFREEITEFLIPGDASVTKAAVSEMIESIETGTSVGEAITVFCRELIYADLE